MFVAQKMLFSKHIVKLIDIYGKSFSHTMTINEILLNIKCYEEKCQFSNKDT